MKFTVAIDGPGAAGKGTISRSVAAHFGMGHLDTGLLYRAVARKVLDSSDIANAAEVALGLRQVDLQSTELRNVEVAQMASRVAAIPEVRSALVEFQKRFAQRDGGAILDGRDIGTVICPDADVKIFVTASPAIRAQRRFDELLGNGEDVTFEEVLSALKIRDKRDAEREVAPLKPAQDAVMLDTSDLEIAEAVQQAVDVISQRLSLV